MRPCARMSSLAQARRRNGRTLTSVLIVPSRLPRPPLVPRVDPRNREKGGLVMLSGSSTTRLHRFGRVAILGVLFILVFGGGWNDRGSEIGRASCRERV